MKAAIGAIVFLLLVAIGFGIVSLLLWWLVPLAFPALAFSFWNALALTGIVLLIASPAAVR